MRICRKSIANVMEEVYCFITRSHYIMWLRVCLFTIISGLTHSGRDEMDKTLQTIFSKAFFLMIFYKFLLRFNWDLIPIIQLTIFQHWFRYRLGAGQAPSHYLSQWWLSLLTLISVTRTQWVYGKETLTLVCYGVTSLFALSHQHGSFNSHP